MFFNSNEFDSAHFGSQFKRAWTSIDRRDTESLGLSHIEALWPLSPLVGTPSSAAILILPGLNEECLVMIIQVS